MLVLSVNKINDKVVVARLRSFMYKIKSSGPGNDPTTCDMPDN